MTRLLFGFLAGLARGSLAHGQGINNGNSTAQSFAQGGTVWLKLSSGDYKVRAGTIDRIVVQWRAEDDEHTNEMKKIKVRTELSGSVATIRTDGPTKHALFTIEIPPRSGFKLRMRAGDVRIDGIEGNKDIRMTAGDLNIALRPAAYSRVHASVTFGDLEARPLGISKDGIGNSLDWTGAGSYTFHASLFAGDLKLSQ